MSANHHPFSSLSDETVQSVSETDLIERIRNWLGSVCPPSPHGIGDDCAVTDLADEKKYLLTTVDGVAWNEHFDDTVPPYFAGRKLMARNLSDIASMGGIPRRAVVSLWLCPQVKLQWLEEFYRGIADLAEKYGVEVVGGDVSRAPQNVFISDLCLQGTSDSPLLRKQVIPGDTIWVTGVLGGSIKGKHCRFDPRIEEGKWLNVNGWAKSMMDISDGLAKDLGALVGKHQVKVHDLPVSDAAIQMSEVDGRDVWEHSLCDGEDYELVFVLDKDASGAELLENWKQQFPLVRLTQVGAVESSESDFVLLTQQDKNANATVFRKKGYEHF